MKKYFGSQSGTTGPKSAPKLRCLPFFKFDSLFFLEKAYNDNLQQCITSSRG